MQAAENFTMPVHMFSCQLLILIICMSCISTQFTQQKEHWTNVKIIFLHTICLNSDLFRYNVVIFRELRNGWIMKYLETCP